MEHLPSIRRLQLFEELGRQLNFRRTAEAIGIAQPALTRAIKQLEDELGFELFARTSRSTQLTPAGRILHLRVGQWLQDMDVSIRDCRRLAQGGGRRRLLLGYSAQASQGQMSQYLFRFGLQNSDIELNLRQLPSEAAYEEIAAGDLHGAFVLQDDAALNELDLQSMPVERQEMVVLCSANHPLAGRGKIPAEELHHWELAIGSAARWQVFRRSVLAQLARLGVTPKLAYEADDTPLLLEAIAQGEYLGVYGSSIVGHLPHHLVALTLAEDISLAICFAHRARPAEAVCDLLGFLSEAVDLDRLAPDAPAAMHDRLSAAWRDVD
ncbi:LysR family transcriptional regulator [Bordetella sp. BOR01]|uniref:LysR family transcriptional regulator n=1 Tax=Bordetella sp. BOR01 TaxID=2854779 RepID=UPI001C45F936|nr:LysR family transcriptional regulator [Bordetella sp. BOR01]MBV7482106.1 LysR family transcriptional regulator [Bordetella sp. BOR01]